jgi:hypothetical protein
VSETESSVTDETNTEAESTETETTVDPDAGAKKALVAERAARKAAEKDLAEARAALAAKDKSAEEQALDAARRDAVAEVNAKANARVITAELKSAAKGVLADPADALAFINISDFELDTNGDVDSDALNEAIADLLARKPHLAAVEANRFRGGGDGGAALPPKPTATAQELAATALAAGDVRGSIAHKLSTLQPIKP